MDLKSKVKELEDKLKAVALWKWILILAIIFFGLGFFVCYNVLKPEVDVTLELEKQELRLLNDRLNEEIEWLYVKMDSTDAYYEKKSLDWQYEDQQTEERNRYQVPAEARRINSSDVASQLEYIKSLRDSANRRLPHGTDEVPR